MSLINVYFSWCHRTGAIRTVAAGGLNRTYLVHVPKGCEAKAPLPVVLALHGATMNGPMMAWFSDLNRKADDAGKNSRQVGTEYLGERPDVGVFREAPFVPIRLKPAVALQCAIVIGPASTAG
jgi:hypothetical protein